MRLDGKAFHTLTRHCKKPFDNDFIDAMNSTALKLCNEIQGAKCAYVQSDEISILITDFDTLETCAWYDYNIQKMVSVSAAIASVIFTVESGGVRVNRLRPSIILNKPAYFDSRVFNVPIEEVTNYFIWRQKDWERNSMQMLGQAHFSQKQLHGKSNLEVGRMLMHEKNVNWFALEQRLRTGTFICKTLLSDMPNDTGFMTMDAPYFT
jgi:tRNA(His) 5'-end guanylyltransferase